MIFVQRKLKIETEAEYRYLLLAEKKPLKDLIVLLWSIVDKEMAFDKYCQSLLPYYLVSAKGEFEMRSVVPWGPNTLNPIKCIKI